MKKNYAVITSDEYFYIGIESLVKNKCIDDQVHRVTVKDIDKDFNLHHSNSYIFIVYLHSVSENFIVLSRFDEFMGSVIFFAKDKRISNICRAYGVNCIDIEFISEVYTVIKHPNKMGFRNNNILSYKERYILTKLLNGWSMNKLALEKGISYKTVSTHKRNGLLKLGVRNINLLINNLNDDVLRTLSMM